MTKLEIVKKLEEAGADSSYLDVAVFDAMGERIAAINNGGLTSQVDFLVEEGWTQDAILALVTEQEDIPREL